jgi:CheY-like chemotaxis protein
MGYAGRIGVFEVLAIDDNLRSGILRSAQETELWGLARAGGLSTLLDDALDKVRDGATTLEEIAGNVPIDPWRPRRRRRGAGMMDPVTSPRPVGPPRAPAPRPLAPQQAPAPVADLAHEDLEELSSEALTELLTAEPRTPVLLAVDDADEILTLIAATLEGTYQVEFARDGVEGLEMVKKITPDLVILDVMMPRMTGYEMSQKLKDDPATRDIPVLMLSARGDTAHVKQGFHAGADDYLPKPFDPEELELRIRALLRRSARR